MLPQKHNESVQVKIYNIQNIQNIQKDKKYICKDQNHKVTFTDSTYEFSWTLERKNYLYVESYDPDCRMVNLNDSYIIYYIHNDTYHYLNIICNPITKNIEYTIQKGTSNYNRHLLTFNKDGKLNSANTEIGVELHNAI